MQFIKKCKTRVGELPEKAYFGILSCVVYSICSMSMTFTNKAIFSTYNFQFPLCLLFFQHIFTLVLVISARTLGYISFTPLKWNLVQSWYPVNLLFILMLISGSYAIKLLSVPMVTIFKNLSTTVITIGDYFLFGQPLSMGILFSVFLMIASSLVAGYNDLAFDANGYTWMGINAVVTAGYVLYMRFAMKKTQLNEWGMVYYNNSLAIPTLLPMLLVSGEMTTVMESLSQYTYNFYGICFWTGISGFLLSISSFWAVRTTSPTTYSMVGSLNKIPLTILGVLFFETPMKLIGGISIAIGLVAGGMYSIAKQRTVVAAETLPHTRPSAK